MGWCTPEFAALPPKLHAAALRGLAKRTTPANALAVLWAAEAARARLAPMVDAYADVIRPLIDTALAQTDAVLGAQTAAVLAEADWGAIMRADGARFEDGERVEWVMRGIVRGVSEVNAGRVYQALVNVLLLPHPDPVEEGSFPAQPLLSQTSHVRVQVEQARCVFFVAMCACGLSNFLFFQDGFARVDQARRPRTRRPRSARGRARRRRGVGCA